MGLPSCGIMERRTLNLRYHQGEETESFFDTEGNYHFHNPNLSESMFKCNEGHYWMEYFVNPCGSCEFGHEDLRVVETHPKLRHR